MSPAEAAKWADVVMVLTPDELQADIYNDDLAPNMKPGAALAFAHGLNVHFNLIDAARRPRRVHDRAQGPRPHRALRVPARRRRALPGGGGAERLRQRARDRPQLLPRRSAAAAPASIETSFKEECETDLFGEQVVLCGGLVELIKAGYETLVEAGYAPEMAYFECLHEVKLIVDLIYEGGIANMHYSISNTAEYGDYLTGPRIVTDETKAEMKRVLADIQSGRFARDWMLENRVGQASFKAMRKKMAEHPIEEIGAKLRGHDAVDQGTRWSTRRRN